MEPQNKTQLDNNQQRPEFEFVEDPATDKEKRQEIANKFYNLSSSIKNSLDTLKTTLQVKQTMGFRQYAVLTSDQELQLIKSIDSLNQDLGIARSMLDSYITFTRSQPDFDKFLNLFYNFHRFITDHRSTIFYQVNSSAGNFYYPYSRLDNGFNKLSFLFSRLCGTLTTAGDYITDQPPSRPSSMPISDPSLPWRGGNYDYTPPFYDDWRRPFIDRDYGNQPRKKIRDIGDIDDKI